MTRNEYRFFFFQTNMEDESTAMDMATTPIHPDFQLDCMS